MVVVVAKLGSLTYAALVEALDQYVTNTEEHLGEDPAEDDRDIWARPGENRATRARLERARELLEQLNMELADGST